MSKEITILNDYTGLCLCSGGSKGILELGALHQLIEMGKLKNLTHIAGSSVGAMIGVLLAVGFSPLEMLLSQCDQNFIHQFSQMNPVNIASMFGLYPQSVLKDKIKSLIMGKIGYIPTFTELQQKMGKYLLIPVYCIGDYTKCSEVVGEKIFLSPDTTPNMSVLDALTLSSSIPFIFEQAVYENKVYIDGAFNTAFPMQELINIMPNNSNILGITFDRDREDLTSLIGYLRAVIGISIFHPPVDGFHDNITVIKLDSSKCYFTGLNLSISTKERINLFIEGSKQITAMVKTDGSKNKEKSE